MRAVRPTHLAALAAALLAAACACALAASPAAAFTSTPLWKCRASALYTSIAGNNRVEPIVANGNPSTANNASPDRRQCANEDAGADNLATPLGVPTSVIGAQTASATTRIDPELGLAIDQKVASTARIENLTLPLGGTEVVLGVAAANSTALGGCAGGQPVLTAQSSVAGLTLGGTTIPLDGLAAALQELLAPLNPIIDVKFNEQVREGGALTVRAAHVKVLPGDGSGPPLADIVLAESKVDTDGEVCNPDKQIPGLDQQICPTGSNYDSMSGFCIIPATATNQLIVVGRPFEGPSGGTVVALTVAQQRFPTSDCLKDPKGKKFAVIGTNKADRITGSNSRDLILSLGGNDAVASGRGDDCVEGGTGSDRLDGGLGDDRLIGATGNETMTGGLGDDVMDGGTGNDKVNGGSGADRITAGTGNDIVQSGFGKDRIDAGAGNDVINVAIQGPNALVDCGAGRDKIRANNKERRGLKGCEITYLLKDR